MQLEADDEQIRAWATRLLVDRQPVRKDVAAHLAQLSLQYDAIEQLRVDRRERRLRAAQSYNRSIETSRQKPPAGTHIRRVA